MINQSQNICEFHYCDGTVVHKGDRVQTSDNRIGVVEAIVQPETEESKQFLCPDGAVLIIEDWNGIKSPIVMKPPDGKFGEDIIFISREPLVIRK
jgi:hypothetical protein